MGILGEQAAAPRNMDITVLIFYLIHLRYAIALFEERKDELWGNIRLG